MRTASGVRTGPTSPKSSSAGGSLRTRPWPGSVSMLPMLAAHVRRRALSWDLPGFPERAGARTACSPFPTGQVWNVARGAQPGACFRSEVCETVGALPPGGPGAEGFRRSRYSDVARLARGVSKAGWVSRKDRDPPRHSCIPAPRAFALLPLLSSALQYASTRRLPDGPLRTTPGWSRAPPNRAQTLGDGTVRVRLGWSARKFKSPLGHRSSSR